MLPPDETPDQYEDEIETEDVIDPQVEMLDLSETDPTFIPPDEDQVEREGQGDE